MTEMNQMNSGNKRPEQEKNVQEKNVRGMNVQEKNIPETLKMLLTGKEMMMFSLL